MRVQIRRHFRSVLVVSVVISLSFVTVNVLGLGNRGPVSSSQETILAFNAQQSDTAEFITQLVELDRLSPDVDVQRIGYSITSLRRIVLDEASSLGLQDTPSQIEEYVLTYGQRMTLININVSPLGLPDRSVPVMISRLWGDVAPYAGGRSANFIEIVVDLTNGDVVATAVGLDRGQQAVDVHVADRGYRGIDVALTPQAPLPVPSD